MEHNELYHHGIKGQRWGVRRFQKKDGSLTAAGKKRYDVMDETPPKLKPIGPSGRVMTEDLPKYKTKGPVVYDKSDATNEENSQNTRNDKIKKAVVIGMTVSSVALATYGSYKVSQIAKNNKLTMAGKEAVNKVLTNKSYASMTASEARELRNKAVGEAVKNGYKPTGNNQVDMLNFLNSIAPTSTNVNRATINKAPVGRAAVNTAKSYASMTQSEARELRNKAVGIAVKNGYKPTGNNQVDMLNMLNRLLDDI